MGIHVRLSERRPSLAGKCALRRKGLLQNGVLQCVAVCCSVLQCVAVCCSVLQCVAVCCSVLQCVAIGGGLRGIHVSLSGRWHRSRVCGSMYILLQSGVLQYVAVCCSVLQCVAVCCSVLQCVAVCCSVLQCVAVCCSVQLDVQTFADQFYARQHTAIPANTLPRTATHWSTYWN